MNKKLSSVLLSIIVSMLLIGFFGVNFVQADLMSALGITQLKSGAAKDLPDKSVTEIVGNVVLWLLGMVSVLALAVLVVGGLMYILALGDEKKAEKAKKIILYAIVGVLVAGASFAILATIKSLLI